jgi:hypothetical protein
VRTAIESPPFCEIASSHGAVDARALDAAVPLARVPGERIVRFAAAMALDRLHLTFAPHWADAIGYFQGDTEGLEVTGELDGATARRLADLHDCEDADSDADSSTTSDRRTA